MLMRLFYIEKLEKKKKRMINLLLISFKLKIKFNMFLLSDYNNVVR